MLSTGNTSLELARVQTLTQSQDTANRVGWARAMDLIDRRDLLSVRRFSLLPVIDFEIDKTKAMDLIDRLDDLKI
jgi:hypothetical protein